MQTSGPGGGDITVVAYSRAHPRVVFAGTRAGLFRSDDGGSGDFSRWFRPSWWSWSRRHDGAFPAGRRP